MNKIRATLWTLGIWCATSSLAGAVSTYDVIELSRQGYSNEQITDIVRVTGSVFKLTAPDILRLKELGVSEAVIREMLRSGPGNPAMADQLPQAYFDDYGSATSPDRFSLQAVSDEVAGEQQQLYVTVLGAPVLVLRAGGQFRSVEDRGTAIVQNLEEAVRLGDGGFRLLRKGDAVQVVYHSVSLSEVAIITLDRHDTDDYDVRSERRVTTEVLASYWAALLNDYWAISVQHRPPSRLVRLQHGAALTQLFELVHAADSAQQESIDLASEQVPVEIWRDLERLATAVPDDFHAYPGLKGDMS